MLNDLIVLGRNRWREKLAREYEAEARKLQSAYKAVVKRMEADNAVFIAKLAELEAKSGITAQAIQDMPEFSRLLARMKVEMDGFARELADGMWRLKEDAVIKGGVSALELAEMTSGRILASQWLSPDPNMLRELVGYLESPAMRDAIGKFGANASTNLTDVILALTAQGKGSRVIGTALENWYSVPFSWGENMARTVQAWSYRGATHANYRANGDIITGWMWWATLDGRVCVSCLAMHGTIHKNDETLNDHHRGRCTPLPIVEGTSWWRETQSGEDWLSGQSESRQREIMGVGLLDAWRKGRVNFGGLSVEYEDKIYGKMRRAKTLAEAVR